MKQPRVDFDEVQKAMEDTERDAFDYFLDTETGDVIILSEDILKRARELLSAAIDDEEQAYEAIEFDEEIDIPDWMEEEIDLALDIFLHDRSRYVRIPERDPGRCHTAMTSFAGQLADGELKDRLLAILDGAGAFRRFKDALAPHAAERKQWYRYNAKCSREEIAGWLATVLDSPAE